MDVGDDRDRREAHDRAKSLRVLVLGDGHARQLAPGRREGGDLGRSGLDIVRLRQRHRLDDDRGAAANRHVADGYLTFRGHAVRV